jgi:hypothetical protein
MAFLDLLKPRAGAGVAPGLPDPPATAHIVAATLPAPPVDRGTVTAHQPSPMHMIADRLEQRIAADFAMLDRSFVAGRRRSHGPSIRRLAAHLGAEARALHALGPFTMTLELSPAAANAWLLPPEIDPANLPGGWADALYSNRLGCADEVARALPRIGHILRPGGLLVADLPAVDDGLEALDRAVRCSRHDGPATSDRSRRVGFDLVETRDPGLLQGRSWRRAILVRRVED